jgi:hypothetical protein
VCVWAEDPTVADASTEAMWRRIHALLNKRRRRGACLCVCVCCASGRAVLGNMVGG